MTHRWSLGLTGRPEDSTLLLLNQFKYKKMAVFFFVLFSLTSGSRCDPAVAWNHHRSGEDDSRELKEVRRQ